jgi:hypothetical protein
VQLKKSEKLAGQTVNMLRSKLGVSGVAPSSPDTENPDALLARRPVTPQIIPHITSEVVIALRSRMMDVVSSKLSAQLHEIIDGKSDKAGLPKAVMLSNILSASLSSQLILSSGELIQEKLRPTAVACEDFPTMKRRIAKIGQMINENLENCDVKHVPVLTVAALREVSDTTNSQNVFPAINKLLVACITNKSLRTHPFSKLLDNPPSNYVQNSGASIDTTFLGSAIVLSALVCQEAHNVTEENELMDAVCSALNTGFVAEAIVAAGFIIQWVKLAKVSFVRAFRVELIYLDLSSLAFLPWSLRSG